VTDGRTARHVATAKTALAGVARVKIKKKTVKHKKYPESVKDAGVRRLEKGQVYARLRLEGKVKK